MYVQRRDANANNGFLIASFPPLSFQVREERSANETSKQAAANIEKEAR